MRTILGLPYILFFPGYVLISFLFPVEEPLDKIERVALSFGLSIAITPLIGLLLNYVWEISLTPILSSLSIFIYIFALLSAYRRAKVPLEERFSIYLEINPPDWNSYDIIDKALVVATVGLLIASGGLAYHIATTPRTGERFTEFYLLGEGGMADDYPWNLTVNESGTLSVGIINREHEEVNYTLVIGLGLNYEDMERIGDLPSNLDFTLPSNNTYRDSRISLDHKEKWEQTIELSIETPGQYRLSFFLLRDGEVYRNTHIWTNVQEPPNGDNEGV